MSIYNSGGFTQGGSGARILMVRELPLFSSCIAFHRLRLRVVMRLPFLVRPTVLFGNILRFRFRRPTFSPARVCFVFMGSRTSPVSALRADTTSFRRGGGMERSRAVGGGGGFPRGAVGKGGSGSWDSFLRGCCVSCTVWWGCTSGEEEGGWGDGDSRSRCFVWWGWGSLGFFPRIYVVFGGWGSGWEGGCDQNPQRSNPPSILCLSGRKATEGG